MLTWEPVPAATGYELQITDDVAFDLEVVDY